MRASHRITAFCCLTLMLSAAVAAVARPESPGPDVQSVQEGFLIDVRADVERARSLGCPKHAPEHYRKAVDALAAAEQAIAADPAAARSGACADEIAAARAAARRALAAIGFIEELRDYRYGWEEAVNRYDSLVEDVSTIVGIEMPPGLSGPSYGHAMVDSLTRRHGLIRAHMDSLARENRGLRLSVMGEGAVKDSTIVRLQTELGELRQRLWEMELRAGVAEADGSAAREQLRRKQEREDKVRDMVGLFEPDEGEILLTPEGDVRVRLTGFGFAVGSAWLGSAQAPLLEKLATVAGGFPDAPLRVEGHTDDTGTREINIDLSLRRARAVANDLAERLGLPQDSIAVEGLGPDQPIATNATEQGRALNRRIEIVILAGRDDG